MSCLNYQLLFLLFVLYISDFRHASAGLNTSNQQNNVSCINKEREALLRFKHGMLDRCGLLTSWGGQQGNQDCCNWPGVRCNNHTGHIIELDLHGNGFLNFNDYDCHLEGKLSDSLGELKHLKYLDLSSNDFLGQPIPTFIGSLSKLEHLNLSYANFIGEIPEQLGNLSHLTFLDLSYITDLYAYSLQWLSHLTLLKDLDLSTTYLIENNDWFQAINNLPFLRTLHLDWCDLPSTICTPFSFINSSSNLAVFSLANNFLNDSSIFEWLFNLSGINTQLVHLDLSHNSFSGPIPTAFRKLHALSYLDLSHNQLKGRFSNAMGYMRSLTYLDLSHNSLDGFIPRTIRKLKSLSYLQLSDNSFSGPIPNEIGNLQSLSYLKLSNNLLSNSIPDALDNIKSLAYLDLSHNLFSSSIPTFLGNMLSLTSLDLSHNLLIGVIPHQLDQFGLLTSLDLSFNQLLGPIPPALGKFQEETFLGNHHLCGNPLPDACPVEEGRDIPSPQENESGSDNFYVGLIVSFGIGFYLGFLGVCVILVLKHAWRYAVFQFVDNVFNRIYVIIAIYMARRSERNFEGQNM
ncbi:unnamed protein product [Amaranthus hypochondriacus]